MTGWLLLACAAAVAWGIVGLLQKLAAGRLSAAALLVWVVAGLVATVPVLMAIAPVGAIASASSGIWALGIGCGLLNGTGAWLLFRSLEHGGEASIAIPVTAVYPIVTALLSVIFLGESLKAHQWAGVALAVIGAVLLSHEDGSASADSAQGSVP